MPPNKCWFFLPLSPPSLPPSYNPKLFFLHIEITPRPYLSYHFSFKDFENRFIIFKLPSTSADADTIKVKKCKRAILGLPAAQSGAVELPPFWYYGLTEISGNWKHWSVSKRKWNRGYSKQYCSRFQQSIAICSELPFSNNQQIEFRTTLFFRYPV